MLSMLGAIFVARLHHLLTNLIQRLLDLKFIGAEAHLSVTCLYRASVCDWD